MSGGIVALVPTRGLRNGKTRLSCLLSEEARALLTERMLRGVVSTALASATLSAVAVISPDATALDVARTLDPRVVPLAQDPDTPGLNAAIAAGRAWALRQRAAAMLVLFGDLPLLTPADVREVVTVAAPVVLAPDRHERGTNALLLRFGAPHAATERFAFHFGVDSAIRHAAEARHLGLPFAIVSTPGTAFDLDTPEDWHALLSRANADSDNGSAIDVLRSSLDPDRLATGGDRR
jgi:2-phospho-L-lactate guanylyltransferase